VLDVSDDTANRDHSADEDRPIEVTDRRSSRRPHPQADAEPPAGADASPDQAPEPSVVASADSAQDAEPLDALDDDDGPIAGDDLDDDAEPPPHALFPDSVYDVLTGALLMLSEMAWVKIGLRANPATSKVERDFDQARIAIDTVAFIVEQLAPGAPAEHVRELRTLVANLKINFARQKDAAG
jgi:hypothetical protein